MNLISDDRGVAFGLFLFFAIVGVALISYAVIEPVFTGAHDAFDDDYRNEYLTDDAKDTAGFLETMFYGGAFLFVVFMAAIMVINRAILKGDIS